MRPSRGSLSFSRAALRGLRSALLVGVGTYLVLLIMLTLLQARLVYFPDRRVTQTPAQIGLEFEEVWLRTADDLRLHGWWVPAPEPRGVVLLLHGNAGNVSYDLPMLALLHRLGYSTLSFDYRGYGRSEGRPSEAGTYRDAEAAWRHLIVERGVAPGDVVLVGRSLGGAIAAYLAEQQAARALVLESTFTSLPELGAELYPFLPVRWLARIRYDTHDRLSRIALPVLVIHSRDDEIVPFHHGRRLWEVAGGRRAFLELGGGHNDGFFSSGHAYEDGLATFLRSLESGPDSD